MTARNRRSATVFAYVGIPALTYLITYLAGDKS